MIPFFVFYLRYLPTNEIIYFSKSDGSETPVVIVDDGWSPATTPFFEDGGKTWGTVTEEIECMTNVATRDEALALLEKLTAFVYRAVRDIEEKQQYTSLLYVRSQFSTELNDVLAWILSPPDEGNVITLSSDIQTAPPGQIRFKFRFKRSGYWITFTSETKQHYLISQGYGYKGLWFGSASLSTAIQLPTPVKLILKPLTTNNGKCAVETFFLCFNVVQPYVAKSFEIPPYMNVTPITYLNSLLAQNDTGYLIQSNAVYSSDIAGPYNNTYMPKGTYAIFVSWRSVQPNIPHALKLRFITRDETNYALLFAKDTHPKLTFLDTITLRGDSNRFYLLPKIGHSTGFEIEKLIFVQLKLTSSVIQLQGLLKPFFIEPTENLTINNSVLSTKSYAAISDSIYFDTITRMLYTYDSLNIVADNEDINTVAIGHSPEVFSLRAYNGSTYAHVDNFEALVNVRFIRTTIH